MKVRDGFVSNSSSSSFIVARKDLTNREIELIENYNNDRNLDNWDIQIGDVIITGFTIMDNDDFKNYLIENNINTQLFNFEDESTW